MTAWWPFRRQVPCERRSGQDRRCAPREDTADMQEALHQIAEQRTNDLRDRLACLGVEVASIAIPHKETTA